MSSFLYTLARELDRWSDIATHCAGPQPSAASRSLGMPYSRLVAGLKKANIELNRKVLAEIAADDEA